jgi:tripeptidyl-peptidase-1
VRSPQALGTPPLSLLSLIVSMRFSTLLLGALGVCAAQAAVIPTTHVVHEKRHAPPRKWVKRDRVSSEAILPMRIGLKQRNLEQGHSLLMDV